MTSEAPQSFAAGSPGASGPGREEPPAYVAVRATVHLPHGMPRGREAIVDAQNPRIQQLLACEWLLPLDDPDAIPRGE